MWICRNMHLDIQYRGDIIIPTLEIRGGDYKHVSYILYVCMLRRIRHAKRGDRGDVLVLILRAWCQS